MTPYLFTLGATAVLLTSLANWAHAGDLQYRTASKGLRPVAAPVVPVTPPAPQFELVTWSPTDKEASVTLSDDRLTAFVPVATWIRATMGKSTGKWYWEIVPTGAQTNIGAGVATDAPIPNLADTRQAYSVWGSGYYCNYGCNGSYEWAKFKSGDVLGFAVDATKHTLQFYVNGVYRQTVTIPTGVIYPAAGGYSNGSYLGKFKAANWSYAAPTGYAALQ